MEINRDGRRRSAFELLALPGVDLARLGAIWPELRAIDDARAVRMQVDARYASYLQRQEADVASLRREAGVTIPVDLDYRSVASLSSEVRQRLEALRPVTLAQAGRMEGMTPAAMLRLLAHLNKVSPRQPAEREREEL